MQKISGLIITFNEEHNIAACLKSLKRVCDDIVVIDSISSDQTKAIAQAEGATVINQAFLGDGPQRSVGLAYCKHDWVLNLDADERLEDDLVDYLNAIDLDRVTVDAIETRRRNFVGQRTTRFAGQYPDYVRRIFNKTKTDFSPVRAHTKILSKNFIQADVHIRHFSYQDYPDIFRRAVLYGTWQAVELQQKGKQVGRFAAAFHGVSAFAKHYFLKLGFLAGADGLAISLGKALASYLKYAHAYELQSAKK